MAPVAEAEVTKHSVHTLVFRSQKRSHEMFIHDQGNLPESDREIDAMIKKIKSKSFYSQNLVQFVDREKSRKEAMESRIEVSSTENIESATGATSGVPSGSNSLAENMASNPSSTSGNQMMAYTGGNQLQKRKAMSAMSMPKPNWHAPWKLYRVISGKSIFFFVKNTFIFLIYFF